MAFKPLGAVTVARVAPRGYSIQSGDAVTSEGCDHGGDPTVEHSQIVRLDKFLDPVEQRIGHKIAEPHAPWNVEVAFKPEEGRSGGGLFSADGMVIGICNAAEPLNRDEFEAIFAGLGTIHRAGSTTLDFTLSAADRAAHLGPRGKRYSPVGRGSRSLLRWEERPAGEHRRRRDRPRTANAEATGLPAPPNDARRDPPQTARGLRGDVHRPRPQRPAPRSQVFTLDEASPIFVNQLSRAAQPPNTRHETAMEVSKRRTPILEWDAAAGYLHQGPLPR